LPNVLGGIYCAVTRRDLKGCEPYLEDQAFTVKESIDSFTKNSAVSSFEEDIKGRIKEGFLADFTLLDKNLFDIDPCDINKAKVLGTYLGGKKVY
ncbi:MAG: amidohydrolase family protein, partial [Clostridia bacterium]|nr:amidohydrolase family protein [Clostridia bacterium]